MSDSIGRQTKRERQQQLVLLGIVPSSRAEGEAKMKQRTWWIERDGIDDDGDDSRSRSLQGEGCSTSFLSGWRRRRPPHRVKVHLFLV